jgi:hypothetical protein
VETPELQRKAAAGGKHRASIGRAINAALLMSG